MDTKEHVVRIIPCLDMKDGRVVKGVKFENLVDAGDPLEIAKAYCAAGADELVFLDITATTEGRKTTFELIERLAKYTTIPFSVGGGISSVDDIQRLIDLGAAKVSMGSAAFKNPDLITQASTKFGSERIVVAIDAARRENGQRGYEVVIKGGKERTGRGVIEFAKEAESRGAGELLVTSKDCDGARQGYDNVLNKEITDSVSIPVIASGGAGSLEHFADAVFDGGVSAVLAASLFHFGEVRIEALKSYLRARGIKVSI